MLSSVRQGQVHVLAEAVQAVERILREPDMYYSTLCLPLGSTHFLFRDLRAANLRLWARLALAGIRKAEEYFRNAEPSRDRDRSGNPKVPFGLQPKAPPTSGRHPFG